MVGRYFNKQHDIQHNIAYSISKTYNFYPFRSRSNWSPKWRKLILLCSRLNCIKPPEVNQMFSIQVQPQHQTSRNLSHQALLASAINASLKHQIKVMAVMAVMAQVEYHTADPWRLSDHVLPPKQQLEGCKNTGQSKEWCKFNKMKLHKMLKMLRGHSFSRVSDIKFPHWSTAMCFVPEFDSEGLKPRHVSRIHVSSWNHPKTHI